MDTLIIALVLLAAVGFLAKRMLASLRSARATKDGCGSSCGCSPAAGRMPKDWDTLQR
jgi:hypothetical protein